MRRSRHLFLISASAQIGTPQRSSSSGPPAGALLELTNPQLTRGTIARQGTASTKSVVQHRPYKTTGIQVPEGHRTRQITPLTGDAFMKFQSTRPARGAISARIREGVLKDVSIHAPRAGRDPCVPAPASPVIVFQSTRPARGATTLCAPGIAVQRDVSIHAPRAGRDDIAALRRGARLLRMFQSTRPARGATTRHGMRSTARSEFQSTRPARGATLACQVDSARHGVSIHAPRAGRDVSSDLIRAAFDVFQSTRPRGARRGCGDDRAGLVVSIHAPRAGRDRQASREVHGDVDVSIHAPRAGRDSRSSQS